MNTPINTDENLLVFDSLIEERGPTVKQLRDALGLASTSSTVARLDHLASRGLIEVAGTTEYGLIQARGWRLTRAGERRIAQLRRSSLYDTTYNITPLGMTALADWRAKKASD